MDCFKLSLQERKVCLNCYRKIIHNMTTTLRRASLSNNKQVELEEKTFQTYVRSISSIVQNIDAKNKYSIESQREEFNRGLLESLIFIRNHLKQHNFKINEETSEEIEKILSMGIHIYRSERSNKTILQALLEI